VLLSSGRWLRPVVQTGCHATREAHWRLHRHVRGRRAVDAAVCARRYKRARRTPRMTSLKLRAIRLTRLIRDAYAQLRDDYAQLARGSTWREVFVIAVASAAAGTILGLVISALWGLVVSAL
jgi:hypothetical protein